MSALFAAIVSAACLSCTPPRPADAQEWIVVIDPEQYCHHLAARDAEIANQMPQVPEQVMDLITDGKRLCELGQWRRGIVRLRRAHMLLRATE